MPTNNQSNKPIKQSHYPTIPLASWNPHTLGAVLNRCMLFRMKTNREPCSTKFVFIVTAR